MKDLLWMTNATLICDGSRDGQQEWPLAGTAQIPDSAER